MNQQELESIRVKEVKRILPDTPMFMVGMGTCGIGNGADLIYSEFQEVMDSIMPSIMLKQVGCFGFCAQEPLVMAYVPKMPLLMYSKVETKDVHKIVEYALEGSVYTKKVLCRIDEWDHITSKIQYGKGYSDVPHWNEIPFFDGQKKIVLRDAGLIDPESIEEYIAVGGYKGLTKALSSMVPASVIAEVTQSKLRGRGGAGYSTGIKWSMMQKVITDQKYIICNADEGDPGAFMNRNEIESDPHMLIEGMIIGGFAMGATEGIVYVRAEYPLAVKRLTKAIKQAEELGLLGKNILNSGFSFRLHIVEGAGAFVCGEETALIASIEGKAGRPMPRPPYPAQKGLYGKPTNINNVETWCNIPVIIDQGSKWFTQTGTAKSSGTKVFSLVGKVKNTGLVELPLGSTIDKFVFQIGEGTGTNKRVKAVQTGGPSGGCIPVEYFNTPVDYESLTQLGAIMGSGGMVVMDQDSCMVDIARYFIEFNSAESCGKCAPCREGLAQLLHILNLLSKGEATQRDIEMLELLSRTIKDTAMCGLGQTAPNPILTTLKYFRHEYEEHLIEKRCHSGVCESLFMALCENTCPLHMNIPGYLALLKEDRLEEAFELTLRDNPIPGTIGRICHSHCQMRCRRDMIDESVSQGEIHRYLADTIYKMGRETVIYDKLIKEKLLPTNKKIAVVGAGPAGLTLAFYMVRMGHAVTVYDSRAEAGGVARYGIPQYRLPKTVLAKEVEFIKKLGVKFKYNTQIGTDMTIEELEKDNDIVYLAVGAWKEIELKVKGIDAHGVLSGTGFLEDIAEGKTPKIGKSIVVIGAGDVAIDAARSVWRMGSKVTIVYRREKGDMPANIDEIREAEAEGIRFIFLSAPEEIVKTAAGKVKALRVSRMKCKGIDESGRRKPIPTGFYDEIPCDTIIMAVGASVDSTFALSSGIKTNVDGTLYINPFTYQTSRPKVYAGGDSVTGPSSAARAMGMAKKAAEVIDGVLMGESRFEKLFRWFKYNNDVPAETPVLRSQHPILLNTKDRKHNFHEVNAGLTGVQAHVEVGRCLRCDVRVE